MGSRFVRGLTVADLVTLSNAMIGFLAIIVAPVNLTLAAQLILLAAVADGLDGVLARHLGGSDVGPYLDSLADVPSFALAPAVLVSVTVGGMALPGVPGPVEPVIVGAVPALFVGLGVLRLGVYSAYDTTASNTVGVPTTLAATVLAASSLTIHATQPLVLGGTLVLALLMISPVSYPDLLARDALIMGVIHVFTVLFPTVYGRIFPYALVTLAVAYLVFGPWLYWGESERRHRDPASPKGKRS